MMNYEGKRFRSKANTENGEVGGQTIFIYHQDENMVWAEYAGGEILRGTLIGTVDGDGHLSFYYQHINGSRLVRIGTCKSIPHHVDGRLELHEDWQWLDGDGSKGSSVIVEI